MAFAFAPSVAQDQPAIGEINTTPLIDVMLVLLIMFIITIPIQTHSTSVDLPGGNPESSKATVHRIDIDFLNQLYWNGELVSAADLRSRLAAQAQLAEQPEIHLKPDAMARYDVVDQVVADIQRSGLDRVGFIGNEAYAN